MTSFDWLNGHDNQLEIKCVTYSPSKKWPKGLKKEASNTSVIFLSTTIMILIGLLAFSMRWAIQHNSFDNVLDTFPALKEKAYTLFQHLDTNKDGKLSEDEVLKLLSADKDQDGYISWEELTGFKGDNHPSDANRSAKLVEKLEELDTMIKASLDTTGKDGKLSEDEIQELNHFSFPE